MSNGWTPERRARQAEAIRRWKPWEKSTGPATEEGRRISAQNAFRGGARPILRQMNAALRERGPGQVGALIDVLERMNALADRLAATPASKP